MSVVLEVIAGPVTGLRRSVPPGATLRVGRHGDNDVVVADDPTLSRWHFELHYDGSRCLVRDVNSRSGTFRNGHKIAVDELVQDQDELKAGLTRFQVQIAEQYTDASPQVPTSPVPDVRMPAVVDHAAGAVPNGMPGRFPLRDEPLETTFGRARLDASATRLVAGMTDACAIVATLAGTGQVAAAVKLAAAALPPRCAVLWSCRCVRSAGGLSELDAQAVATAERWSSEPTEPNRREAQAIAERLDYGTAAAWTAMAAFWSGGSLTPADAPPVPPSDDLLPQAVVGAISLAFEPVPSDRSSERLAASLAPALLDGLGV